MWPHFFIYFLSSNCSCFSFLYLKNVTIRFHGIPRFGPFWPAKYLNFRGESCKLRILARSIKETYILRKVKNQVLLFNRVENQNCLILWSIIFFGPLFVLYISLFLATFPTFSFWSVNYQILVCKLYIMFRTCQDTPTIFILECILYWHI